MSEEAQQGNPLAEAQRAAENRTRYTFKVPPKARMRESDPTSVTLVEITMKEQQEATRTAQANKVQVGLEMLKFAVVEADGKPLSWKGNEREIWLDQVSPKVRTLLLQAFNHIHAPADEDEADFLASMTAQA